MAPEPILRLPGFALHGPGQGLIHADEGPLRCRVLLHGPEQELELPEGDTHFVMVASGPACLTVPQGSFSLATGMVAAVPGQGRLAGGAGVVVSRVGFLGLFLLGGPCEARGRLRYIDGCTDSLLLAPPVRGDPCLNHLHVPAHTHQSEHHHPSLRAGLVLRGRGRCVTPGGSVPLESGQAFVLEPWVRHAFHTDTAPLDVLVVHPDTDTGPTHEDHPMRNRTLLAHETPPLASERARSGAP